MIKAGINVLKIDKSKLNKNKSGTWLNVVLIETPNSPYDDFLIKMDQTEAERKADPDGVIIGNAKIPKPKDQQQNTSLDDDGVPF